MARYDVYTLDNASPEAKPFLEAANSAFGLVPNLLGLMAEAPSVLEGYLTLNQVFGKSSLSPLEQQVVMMTSNYENNCYYCTAAHSTIMKMQNMPEDVITALRENTPLPDAKLEALRSFTRKMIETRGWVQDSDVQGLIDAGYTKATALEVVMGVAIKVMSNYINHFAQTPLDQPFQANAWVHPDKREAAE